MRPDRPRADLDGPAQLGEAELERGAGRDVALPDQIWDDETEAEEVAAAARTRRAPHVLTVVTLGAGMVGWGVVRVVSVLAGPGPGGLVAFLAALAAALTVPTARAVLRDRIGERWVRTWWLATAAAAAWTAVVAAWGVGEPTSTGVVTALAALALGSWVLGAAWHDEHQVRHPDDEEAEREDADDGTVPEVVMATSPAPVVPSAAAVIEQDWAEYVASGENAIAPDSQLHHRTELAYGWRWTVQLNRRGSVTSTALATDSNADRVALKLVMRSNHVMLEQLPDGQDRADLAMLTVITIDVLADGVPYQGPNYHLGRIRIGRYSDGSHDAEWIAYDHTGVQSGLVTGDPRSGKSAYLAKLAGDFKSSGEWVVLFGDGDPAGGSAPVLAEIADDLARGNDEILQQLEALEAVQRHVRGDLMGTLTIGADGKPTLMTRPDQTPADKMLPCPQYPGIAWFLDEFHVPAAAMRSINFAGRVEKVVRGLAKYGLAVIVSTQSKVGADFGGSSDLRSMLAKNEISFRAENKAGVGVVGDGSTDPSTLPRGGGYAFLGHGDRHAMVRTEFTKEPDGSSNMYRWVPQIQAAAVAMDDLTAAVYERYRPVKVLDRAADHAERTARLDAVRAALAGNTPLPGSPEALAAAKAAEAGEEAGEGPTAVGQEAQLLAGVPSLASVVIPIRRRRPAQATTVPAEQSDRPLPGKAQQVLDALRSRPGAWRSAELAGHTGLSGPDVSKALTVLRGRGLAHRPSGVQGVHVAGPHRDQLKDQEAV